MVEVLADLLVRDDQTEQGDCLSGTRGHLQNAVALWYDRYDISI